MPREGSNGYCLLDLAGAGWATLEFPAHMKSLRGKSDGCQEFCWLEVKTDMKGLDKGSTVLLASWIVVEPSGRKSGH